MKLLFVIKFLCILGFGLSILFFYYSITYSKDLIIHTKDNVYYYPDIEKNETIVLPNDEVIDTEDIDDLKENDSPFRSNEGIEIYRGYDNQYFMEGNDNHDED